jgi:hypothetical protein
MPEPRRAAAYGLALEGEEPLLALLGAPSQAPLRRTVMRVVEQSELDADWPAAGARRLSTERPDPEAPPRTIDEHPEAGWRLDAPGWGCARVAPDGSLIDCARDRAEEWRWQRFLVGRALPFAAVAAGLEVLHAAAVVVDGSALAVTGGSGAGKSSVAAALTLAGAELLTDDVLAVEQRDGSVLAHPGPPLLALRDSEVAALGGERFRRVGELTGEGGGKAYMAVAASARPVPLARLAILRRTGEPGGVEVRGLAQPPARVLLGAVFVPEMATPARLRGQLALLEYLAAGVEVLEVHVGCDAQAGDVAEALTT